MRFFEGGKSFGADRLPSHIQQSRRRKIKFRRRSWLPNHEMDRFKLLNQKRLRNNQDFGAQIVVCKLQVS